MKKRYCFQDTLYSQIEVSFLEREFISSDAFNRLHDVYQNSTAFMTFPCNRTKRFEHSLGTMHLASNMFYRSIANSEEKDLEETFIFYDHKVKKIIYDITNNITEYYYFDSTPDNEYPKIQYESLYNILIPNNVHNEWKTLYLILLQSVRICGLFHDIGHPPFSHIIETAIKNSYEKYKENKTNKVIADFINSIDAYASNNKQLHESISDEISINLFSKFLGNYQKGCDRNYKEMLMFYTIIMKVMEKIFDDEDDDFVELHGLVDGIIDADRMDYISRDMFNSGTSAGVVAKDRIINDMKVIYTDKPNFAFSFKNLYDIEDFLRRRFNLYKGIIFHHRINKTNLLLQKSVEKLIDYYFEITDENTWVEKPKSIQPTINGLWYPFNKGTIKEKMNYLSQWNDAWLITALRKTYFENFFGDVNPKYNILKIQLDEFLQNKKSYFSLVKRDEEIFELFNVANEEFKSEFNTIKEKVESFNQKNSNDTLDKSIDLDVYSKKITVVDSIQSFMNVFQLEFEQSDIDLLSKSVIEFDNRIKDIIIFSKKLNSGNNRKGLYIYSKNELIDFSEISDIFKSLTEEANSHLIFNVYVLPNGHNFDEEEKKKIIEFLGKNICHMLCQKLEKKFDVIE